jgi:taurine---2-oxoglutarate transaminase
MLSQLSSQETVDWCRKLDYGTWRFQKNWVPLHVTDADGCYFTDGRWRSIGCCATSRKIAEYFDDHLFAHGHTYEAHPMTLAPAIATIREMQRLNLVERSRDMGSYVGEKLLALKTKHPSVGDVRGSGLFWAVELFKNRTTKQPVNTMQDKNTGKPLTVEKIAAGMLKNGVAVQAWISHFVIAPPLIIEKDDIDVGVSVLDTALELADAQSEE